MYKNKYYIQALVAILAYLKIYNILYLTLFFKIKYNYQNNYLIILA